MCDDLVSLFFGEKIETFLRKVLEPLKRQTFHHPTQFTGDKGQKSFERDLLSQNDED